MLFACACHACPWDVPACSARSPPGQWPPWGLHGLCTLIVFSKFSFWNNCWKQSENK